MKGTYRRSGGLAVLAAFAAIGLAVCGTAGSSSSTIASIPTVASQGKNSPSGGTTTTLPKGNPTQLLNEWAECMRRHGDPDQADPTIDANRDIDINWNPEITGGVNGTNKGGQGNSGPGQYCRAYLTAAQTALGGNQQQPASNPATLEKYSECMRSNGIADFPDPVNGNLSFNLGASGNLNPNNPTFESASKLCARRTGARVPGTGGSPRPGTIKLYGAGPLPNSDSGENG
jgi:hypothetical protein